MKRITILAAAVSILVLALGVAPSSAAPHGALCQLAGTAKFGSPVTVSPKTVSYTFTGKLTNCRSTDARIKPGGRYLVTASGKGTVSCEFGQTTGTAKVYWNAAHTLYTVVYFATASAAAATDVRSTRPNGGNVFRGDNSHAAIVFQTQTPQACAMGGLSSLTFSGVSGVGGP